MTAEDLGNLIAEKENELENIEDKFDSDVEALQEKYVIMVKEKDEMIIAASAGLGELLIYRDCFMMECFFF